MFPASQWLEITDYPVAPALKTDACAPERPGLMRRLAKVLQRSRQNEADRVIAAFLARSGGLITDGIEREMMQHLASSSWGRRR